MAKETKGFADNFAGGLIFTHRHFLTDKFLNGYGQGNVHKGRF